MSLKIARASQADIDAATKLFQLLNAVDGGNFPPKNDEEEWPEFDEDNKNHLQQFLEDALDCFNHPPSGLMRVLYAAICSLDPDNKLFNPDSNHLDFHPRITQNEADAKRWHWQRKQMFEAMQKRPSLFINTATDQLVTKEEDLDAVVDAAIEKAGG